MKKYLIILILFVIVISCEKDETMTGFSESTVDQETLKHYLSEEELKTYKHISVGTDTNFIYGYGFRDNKLHIKGFHKHTKQNIWSWVSKYNFELGREITINKGYGEVEKAKVIEYSIPYIHKFDNSYTFVLYNALDKVGIYPTHIIISGSAEKVNDLASNSEINSNQLGSHNVIYRWFKDSFLLSSYNTTGKTTLYCYNTLGNILFETEESSFRSYLSTCFPINLNECIILNPSRDFRLINLKTDTTIWVNSIEGIPDNARIDDSKIEIIDKDVTKLTINYTLYEGDKKVYSVKINNITGEFVPS